MEKELKEQKCIPCHGGDYDVLDDVKVAEYLKKVSSEWKLNNERHIERKWKFKDFVEAMDFVNRVADIAEEQGHHPTIFINYNRVKMELWTHAIGGLFDNDFIMAARIDELA